MTVTVSVHRRPLTADPRGKHRNKCCWEDPPGRAHGNGVTQTRQGGGLPARKEGRLYISEWRVVAMKLSGCPGLYLDAMVLY